MDIIGPWSKSSKGNRFVLVICDYATRYLEAFPMRSVYAASVAEKQIELFYRVVVPQEILKNLGTTFLPSYLKNFKEYFTFSQLKLHHTIPRLMDWSKVLIKL